MTLRITPAEIVAKAEASGRPGLLVKDPQWTRVRLGDVATVVNGAAFSSRYFNVDGEGMPLVRIRDVGSKRIGTWYSGPWEQRYRVRRNDILIGMDGDFRVAPWALDDGLLNQRVCRVDVDESRYDARFLVLVLQGYLDAIHKATSSTTVKHLSSRTVADIPLPQPRLDVQRRIVDLLEDHLSRLDAAESSVRQALKRSAAWRRVSLEQLVREIEGSEALLGELASIKNGIFVSRASSQPEGVPILRIGAVRALKLDLSDLRYSRRSPSDLLAENMLLAPGDVVFTRYNGNPEFVGACAAVPAGVEPLTFPDKLIRARVDPGRVLPDFLAIACTVGRGRKQIRDSVKTTAGQAGISGGDLKRIKIRVPDFATQHAAVARAQAVDEHTDRLSITAQSASRRSAALRRALLEAAFSGRLTGRSTDMEIVEELAALRKSQLVAADS